MHTIRQATITDLPTIRHLWQLYAMGTTYPRDQAEDADAFTRGLAYSLGAPEPAVFVFLAEQDGEAIGFLTAEIQRRLIGQPHRYGFCSYLYTLPEHRHRGIAGDLIECACSFALSQGIMEIELNAAPGDEWNLPMGHATVALRQATTATRLLAWLDRRRERLAHANGHDQEAPLTPEPATGEE